MTKRCRKPEALGKGQIAEMTETTDDDEDLERRNRNNLAKAAAVGLLCLLGIVVVRLVQRFLNSIARSHAAES